MATISVSSGNWIRPIGVKGRIRHYLEGASQTFKKGDPLIFITTADKGQKVGISGADPAAIIGFAAEDASGVENTALPVYIADDDLEVRVHVADTQTLDNDNVSAAGFGIVADATNSIWRLDLTETSAKIFKVVKLIDAHGDVNGAVIAKVLAAARAV